MPDGTEMPDISTMKLWLLDTYGRVWESSSPTRLGQRSRSVLGCLLIELTEKTYECPGICSKTALYMCV